MMVLIFFNGDRESDDEDDDEKSLVALEGVNLNRRSLSTSHCFALLGKRTQFKCAKNGTQMQLNLKKLKVIQSRQAKEVGAIVWQ